MSSGVPCDPSTETFLVLSVHRHMHVSKPVSGSLYVSSFSGDSRPRSSLRIPLEPARTQSANRQLQQQYYSTEYQVVLLLRRGQE